MLFSALKPFFSLAVSLAYEVNFGYRILDN